MTPNSIPQDSNREQRVSAVSGWLLLFVNLALFVAAIWLFVVGIRGVRTDGVLPVLGAVALFIVGLVTAGGFFTLQPNEAAVLVLFGSYQGTRSRNGIAAQGNTTGALLPGPPNAKPALPTSAASSKGAGAPIPSGASAQ